MKTILITIKGNHMGHAASSHSKRSLTPSHIVNRIAASLLGGYAFTWGFAALCMAGLVAAGESFHEAEQAAGLLAFLIFLVAFLWAFAATRLARVWLVLIGGGGTMTAAAWALQHTILS
jgi:hypothetical protein